MACYNCNNTPCTSTCGCTHQVKGSCVFYQGANLSCIDATKGDDYDSILVSLNTLICDLQPPSGLATVVTSDCGNITVSNTTADGIITYDLCISTDITNNITENTNDILALQTCVSGGVADIISDTITITEDSSSDCGKVLKLEIPTPSGTPIYGGLVIDDMTGYNPDGTGGLQVVYTNTEDYYTKSLITTGDRIIYIFSGQYAYQNSFGSDSVDIKFFNGATQKLHLISSAPQASEINKSGYYVEFQFNIKDATDVTNATILINAFWHTNLVSNGAISYNSTNVSQSVFNALATGIDLTALKTTVTYTNTSMLGVTYNKLNLISSEVTKKI